MKPDLVTTGRVVGGADEKFFARQSSVRTLSVVIRTRAVIGE
jgi:hypothetical protein